MVTLLPFRMSIPITVSTVYAGSLKFRQGRVTSGFGICISFEKYCHVVGPGYGVQWKLTHGDI